MEDSAFSFFRTWVSLSLARGDILTSGTNFCILQVKISSSYLCIASFCGLWRPHSPGLTEGQVDHRYRDKAGGHGENRKQSGILPASEHYGNRSDEHKAPHTGASPAEGTQYNHCEAQE